MRESIRGQQVVQGHCTSLDGMGELVGEAVCAFVVAAFAKFQEQESRELEEDNSQCFVAELVGIPTDQV